MITCINGRAGNAVEAGTGCRPDAASPNPPRSPTTSATLVNLAWTAGRAGTWKKRSNKQKVRPGSITTRSAHGEPGTRTSLCRCSPWPGWRHREPLLQKGTHRSRRRHDRPHATGDPPPAHRLRPHPPPPRRPHLGLVTLATPRPPTANVPAVGLPGRSPSGSVSGGRRGRFRWPR